MSVRGRIKKSRQERYEHHQETSQEQKINHSRYLTDTDVMQYFVNQMSMFKDDPVAHTVCLLGRYCANFLYARTTGKDNYIEEKWLYLLSQIVTLLHFKPVSGINISPEVKRDNMVFGESWYAEQTNKGEQEGAASLSLN